MLLASLGAEIGVAMRGRGRGRGMGGGAEECGKVNLDFSRVPQEFGIFRPGRYCIYNNHYI